MRPFNKYIILFLLTFIMFAVEIQAKEVTHVDSQKSKLAYVDEYNKAKILSDMCWNLRGSKPDEALLYGFEALSIIQKNSYNEIEAALYNYIGVIYRNIGNYGSAQYYFILALENAERYNDLEQIAYANNNIGDIFNLTQQYSESKKYLSLAEAQFSKIKNTKGLSYTYHQLGLLYLQSGFHNLSLEYFIKSLQLRKLDKDSLGIVASYRNIANCYIYLGKIDSADYYLNAISKIQFKNKPIKFMADVYEGYGYLHLKNNNIPAAIKAFNNSYEINSELKAWKGIEMSAYELYKLYLQKTNFKMALHFFEEYDKSKDMLYNESSLKQVYAVVDKYNLSKAQQLQNKINSRNFWISNTILLAFVITCILLFSVYKRSKVIKKQNTLLSTQHRQILEQNNILEFQKEELETLIATKDKFFSIIAHDLKNPMGAIMNLTGVIIDEFHNLNNDEIKKYSTLVNKALKNLYEFMNNLLTWAKSQTGKVEFNAQNVTVSSMVNSVLKIARIQAQQNDVDLEATIPDDLTIYVDENMITTVIRNLVSNAIKFTTNGGKVVISASKNTANTIIAVHDTGVGIPENSLSKIFDLETKYSTTGTNGESGTGLGLIICKDFVEKNNGKIWVESIVGNGSTFFIAFSNS